MKKFFSRRITTRHTGFTLVELLVVMGIIAILAATTLSIAGTVIAMAKRTKSQNMATQIQTAALAYYTEYSIYPTPSGVTTDYMLSDKDVLSPSGTGNWGNLVECLSGMIQPYNGQPSTQTAFSNTRQIAFLSLKGTDVAGATAADPDAPVNPLPSVGTSNGTYFNIAFDGDYDGVIGSSSETTSAGWLPNLTAATPVISSSSGATTTAGVAVWANCNYRSGMNSSAWYVHTY